MKELVWVIDPDGEEKYLTQEEVDTLINEEDAHYCEPNLDVDDDMLPHYHKWTSWEAKRT